MRAMTAYRSLNWPSRHWAEVSASDFAAAQASGLAARTVAVLPVAAIEQHGPHLPLQVDATLLQGVLDAALPLLPQELAVLVLPPMPVGLSTEHLAYAGTLSLSPATLLALGDLARPAPLLAGLGFVLIVALVHHRVTGAVMLGILAVTGLSLALGLTELHGVVSLPPSLAPTFMELDILGALDVGLISVIFAFLFVDLFDTSGTLIGVAQKAGLVGPDGKLPRLGRALLADSTATMTGAALGTSTTTSFIESAAGISAGGRTGLTACVVAALFLLSLFFSPLAATVPDYATAPALFFVAVLMTGGLAQIAWDDLSEAAPVVVAALAMPLTFSVANGIALGFISWTAIKLCCGRRHEVNSAMWVLSTLFVVKLGFFA